MYNYFLEKIIVPLGDFLSKSSYMNQLKYWRNVDTYSKNELERLQSKNLHSVLSSASKNVPYYENLKLHINDPIEALSQFPVIDKYIIKENVNSLIANGYQKKNLIPYSSSGSSGIQTTVYMTKEEQSIIRGILTHWWEWSGYKLGKSIVQTGITPNRGFVKTLKDLLFRTTYLNAFSHNKEQLETICKKIYKKPDKFFVAGYASSLNILAEFAIAHKYDLKLKGVVSLGDKLFNHYKKNIKNTFKTNVFDTYGSNEGFMIAAQDDLEAYYILSPHVYVEILDDQNKPVSDGEMGNIVVTRLDCFSMPLIRYKIGDLGIKLPLDEYPEKRKYNYPLLKQVVGRETDIIVLPNKTKMVVHSFTGIFEYIPEIKQFKVIQEDLKGITIEYIKSDTFSESTLEKVLTELRKYINTNEFNIFFKEVNYIAPTKSGKPQIIESRLKK